jgi:hypothetical protein
LIFNLILFVLLAPLSRSNPSLSLSTSVLPHALVETLDGQQTMVDRPLAQLGVKWRALRLPFFCLRSSPLLKPT